MEFRNGQSMVCVTVWLIVFNDLPAVDSISPDGEKL